MREDSNGRNKELNYFDYIESSNHAVFGFFMQFEVTERSK